MRSRSRVRKSGKASEDADWRAASSAGVCWGGKFEDAAGFGSWFSFSEVGCWVDEPATDEK